MCVCVGGGEGGYQCRHARGNKDKVGAGCPEGGLLATGHMVLSGPGGPGNLSPPEPQQSTFIKTFWEQHMFFSWPRRAHMRGWIAGCVVVLGVEWGKGRLM